MGKFFPFHLVFISGDDNPNCVMKPRIVRKKRMSLKNPSATKSLIRSYPAGDQDRCNTIPILLWKNLLYLLSCSFLSRHHLLCLGIVLLSMYIVFFVENKRTLAKKTASIRNGKKRKDIRLSGLISVRFHFQLEEGFFAFIGFRSRLRSLKIS